MPPKAAKKGSAKKSSAAGAAGGNKNWEAGLTRAEFEEVCYLTEHLLWFKTFLFLSHKVKLFSNCLQMVVMVTFTG